ncbi:DUF1349 domain-containing protein [Streptomyces sp. PH10-H1]|uniref:DUF1349 domain-containing protein n=1 Tax=Streptomyces sp. PH10-H1 TaxID=3046212 RepID=UPI0024BA2C6A|nr:DUF1349 domain-containing protein [Streptomyces sp. PH10-H1]MDJ0343411.1 DUF1349 domain-containing protein [Streptomyces sp. PH10-H1]
MYTDKATASLSGGKFNVTTPDCADLRADIAAVGTTAPIYYRTMTGDFTAETEVTENPRFSYQGAGLVIGADNYGYIRLERAYGDTGGITFEYYRDDGKYIQVDYAFTTAEAKGRKLVRTDATTVQLRLKRTGGTVTASWRESATADWQQLGQAPTPGSSGNPAPASISAGLSVLNRAQPPKGDPQKAPFTASFDYANLTCG